MVESRATRRSDVGAMKYDGYPGELQAGFGAAVHHPVTVRSD